VIGEEETLILGTDKLAVTILASCMVSAAAGTSCLVAGGSATRGTSFFSETLTIVLIFEACVFCPTGLADGFLLINGARY